MVEPSRVIVTIYPIAGRQFFFRVPDSFCRECELTMRVVERVLAELGDNWVVVEVKPWLENIVAALWRGGWHPPVVTINGRLFSQGVVPEATALQEAIADTIGLKGGETREKRGPCG